MKFTPRPALGLLAGVLALAPGRAQIVDTPDGVVAGIPANYTEARTGQYTLPDPLVLSSGERVTDAKTWYEKRRPEIVRMIEENQYGRCPAKPAGLNFSVDERATPALDGKALRRQITIYFTADHTGPKMEVLLYIPAGATRPVPVLLNASFTANNLTVADPGVRVGEAWDPKQHKRVPATAGRRIGGLDVAPFLAHGFGVATVNYADIDPDAPGAVASGVRGLYIKPGATEPAPDEWGAIAAWGWGLSCVLDYFETDSAVDAKRVALFGVSRLGKTVLWAGARDTRFALVIASCSGEGGAALSRRNYGETVAHLVEKTRYPYQFAVNYQKWANRANEAPFDANLIVALLAPRPLLLQTGNTDKWSDPYGEFLAAKSATPVYELLGADGIAPATPQPPAGKPLLSTLGFVIHDGGHGTVPADQAVFLQYLDAHLKPSS